MAAGRLNREITAEASCRQCGQRILTGASNYGGHCWGCLTKDQREAWRAMEERAGKHIPGDGRAPWEERQAANRGC